MTKAELIDRIARSRDLPPDVTKKCIAEIVDIAFDELSSYFVRAKITRNQTPRFTMPGFGTFTKKRRAPRKGVNPQTLEPMQIAGYDTLDFKPGAELKQALNESRSVKSGSRRKSSGSTRRSKEGSGPKRAASGRRAAGIAGRRLKRRDELEFPDFDDNVLPEAPLQRSRGRRRRKNDDESTG